MTFRYLQSLPAFNRRFVVFFSLLVLLFAIALLVMVMRPPQGKHVWRIAVTDWPGFDPLHMAEEKGLFEEQGLNIDIVPINAIIDMRTAFERGLIDGYTGPLVDVVESIQATGVPAHIVLALDYSNGGDLILANPAIPSTAGLGDARIGVETSSALGRYLLAHALRSKPLTEWTLKLVQGSQPRLLEYAITGKLDALVTYEPYATQLLEKRNMHVIYSSAEIPSEIMDVMAVSPAMLKQEPELSHKLQAIWQASLDYSAAHPSETSIIHARRYGVTPEHYQKMLEGIRQITVKDMQHLTQSGQMANAIRKASSLLASSAPLTPQIISTTLAISAAEEGTR